MKLRTIADVIRGEGLASALRRATERVSVDRFTSANAQIVNVSPTGIAPRTGGIAVQLLTRLRAERNLREVRLAERVTHANAIHFEGTSGIALDDILRLRDQGVKIVISVHDFALFCARPNLIEQPANRFCFYSRDPDRCARCLAHDGLDTDQERHRALARELLTSASGVIFSSQWLYDKHRELFGALDGHVLEPAVPGAPHLGGETPRDAIAFAGNVQHHKGAHFLPEIARHAKLHVFGGGDADLLRELRANPNVTVHGYYRAGTLPALLAKHGVGLVLLPSIFPETYSIALTEAWFAGAAGAVFDHAAPAERIRREGGGWVAPLESGAQGMIEIIARWQRGERVAIPRITSTPESAANAHVGLYRQWGLLT